MSYMRPHGNLFRNSKDEGGSDQPDSAWEIASRIQIEIQMKNSARFSVSKIRSSKENR